MSHHIALVATGSVGTESETRQAASEIENRYQATVTFNENCYHSRPAKQRADILLGHLLDPKVDVIWAVRGGEGTADLLPLLDEKQSEIKAAKPKLLIGFSDFTPLLVYFTQNHGWPCVHGMGALQFVRLGPDALSIEKTDQLIKAHLSKKHLPQRLEIAMRPLNKAAEKINQLEGELIGGNLTLCSLSIKDHWEIQPSGKILFFEDWMEKGYRVARALKYLQRIGKINTATALIFGDFFAKPLGSTPEEITTQTTYFWQVLGQFVDSLDIPAYHTLRIGHGQANDPILLGQKLLIAPHSGPQH